MYPTPPETSRASTAPARRDQNVSDQSTSSTESYIDSGNPYRKGGPGYLPQYPVDTALSRDDVPQAQQLINEAMRLCDERNIRYTITVISRHNQGSARKIPQDITLLITAKAETNQADAWVLMINEILEFFTKCAFGGRVEICDPMARRGKHMFTLGSDNELLPLWDSLHPKILQTLAGSDWKTMVPVRLGYRDDLAVTTILITAQNPKSSAWKDLVRTLQNQLAQEPLKKEIDIEVKDSASLWGLFAGTTNITRTTPRTPDDAFFVNCPNLMSLSLQCEQVSGSGTIGGFIKLREASTGNTEEFGLSCHHVIVENEHGHPLPQDVNQNGCGNLFHSIGNYPVCVPRKDLTRNMTRETMAQLNDTNNQLAANPAPSMTATKISDLQNLQSYLSTKLAALSNHPHLGQVVATSGFRSIKSGGADWTMDWTLIKPTNGRDVSNRLWWADELGGTGLTTSIHDSKSVNGTGLLTQVGAYKTPVYKRGGATGSSIGTVNEITLTGKLDGWPTNVGNQAYLIAPSSIELPMAGKGDSGAWLLADDGSLLGIIHGGDTAHGECLVIPIHDILRDIEQITGFEADVNI